MLKSFFHFRSGARWDEGLPEENGLPASEPAEGAEKVQGHLSILFCCVVLEGS